MTDNRIIQPCDHWNARLNLDSYINGSQMCSQSELGSTVANDPDQLQHDLKVNFQQVVSSNLSVLYSNICQEPTKLPSPHKIQFRQDVQHNEKSDPIQTGKPLLPMDSNIDFEDQERPNFRKPSLVTSTYSKGQKIKKIKNQNDKLEQKENSPIETVTEKHVRIRSENTIQYIPEDEQQSTQISERNPETSFENAEQLFTDLSRQFQYIGDFSLIRKSVIELAVTFKHLRIVQNTSDFVTIKVTSKLDYCQCLIKSCLNVEETGGIFQLKNSLYKRNKAKFILITGNEREYLRFFRSVLIRLWELNYLKLKKNELVQFYVNAEKSSPQMKQLKKEYTQLYNQLSGLSGEPKSTSKSQSQSLISSIKQSIKRLRPSSQKQISEKISTKFEQVLKLSQKVNAKFSELKYKLLRLDECLDYNSVSIERELETEIYFHEFPMWKLFGFFYKAEYECFSLKCTEILKNYSTRRIFTFLEIEEQYSLFLVQRGRTATQQEGKKGGQRVKSCQLLCKQPLGQQGAPVPYQECISLIESLDSCSLVPSKFLDKVSLFYKQLRQTYTQLYSDKSVLRACSMDDELPITIFILLMAQLNSSHSSALNLLGKLRWLMKWVDYQEASVDGSGQGDGQSTGVREDFTEKKKILTMLDAGFVFVIKEWKHEQEAQCKKVEQKEQENQSDKK